MHFWKRKKTKEYANVSLKEQGRHLESWKSESEALKIWAAAAAFYGSAVCSTHTWKKKKEHIEIKIEASSRLIQRQTRVQEESKRSEALFDF